MIVFLSNFLNMSSAGIFLPFYSRGQGPVEFWENTFGMGFTFFNWEEASYCPQIRPRKIPAVSILGFEN